MRIDLRLSTALEEGPHVIGNFVSTLDGVVSYEIPGHAGDSVPHTIAGRRDIV